MKLIGILDKTMYKIMKGIDEIIGAVINIKTRINVT